MRSSRENGVRVARAPEVDGQRVSERVRVDVGRRPDHLDHGSRQELAALYLDVLGHPVGEGNGPLGAAPYGGSGQPGQRVWHRVRQNVGATVLIVQGEQLWHVQHAQGMSLAQAPVHCRPHRLPPIAPGTGHRAIRWLPDSTNS